MGRLFLAVRIGFAALVAACALAAAGPVRAGNDDTVRARDGDDAIDVSDTWREGSSPVSPGSVDDPSGQAPGEPAAPACVAANLGPGLPDVGGCQGPCEGCDNGVPLDVVRQVVTELVRHRIPAPVPRRQPAGRPALVQLPVVFSSGQGAGPLSWRDDVGDLVVSTTVHPTWRWDFGDGATLTTTDPGSRWPDTAVSHTYDGAGSYRVRLSVSWEGSFSIAGVGTFPIDGRVTQQAGIDLRVVPARAVLVPH